MSGFSKFCFFEHFFLFKRKNIMKSTYQHIFSPLNVKNMAIKNRIVMVPMGTKDHRWNSGRKKYP